MHLYDAVEYTVNRLYGASPLGCDGAGNSLLALNKIAHQDGCRQTAPEPMQLNLGEIATRVFQG